MVAATRGRAKLAILIWIVILALCLSARMRAAPDHRVYFPLAARHYVLEPEMSYICTPQEICEGGD